MKVAAQGEGQADELLLEWEKVVRRKRLSVKMKETSRTCSEQRLKARATGSVRKGRTREARVGQTISRI